MSKLRDFWYWLKCFLWHRYTTVKPETLDHTYCDSVELLPHLVMQVLVNFVEKEKAFDCHVDWDWDPEHKNVKEELLAIYHWWKWYRDYDSWKSHWEVYPHEGYNFNREGERESFDVHHREEGLLFQQLTDNCKRILDLRGYMWT